MLGNENERKKRQCKLIDDLYIINRILLPDNYIYLSMEEKIT